MVVALTLLAAMTLGEGCHQSAVGAEGGSGGGGTGTLGISVTGLGSGPTSGGSAAVTRTDVPTPPVTVPIPASGSASTSVPAGTYEVRYSPPSGYVLAAGTLDPQSKQVTAGQTTTASFPVAAAATPDLLNNASFEAGWDGFHNGSNQPPSPSSGAYSITRSQDVAYNGVWSAKSTFGPGGGSVAFGYTFGDHADVSARVYFYIVGAVPNSAHKWIRFQTSGYSGVKGGLYLAQNGLTWSDADGPGPNAAMDLGIGMPTFNTWHSIEVRYDRSNWNGPNGPRVRVWYDGNVVVGTNPNGGSTGGTYTAFWGDDAGTPNPAGPWLYMGRPASVAAPSALLVFDDTINAGNTNSGIFYYDWIAVSTQRIGP